MKYHVEYADEVRFDLRRIAEFLSEWHAEEMDGVLEAMERSIETLTVNPYLGRPVLHRRNRRELIVGRGKLGFIVRYTIDESQRVALVLGIRGQRERGFHSRG